MELRNGTISKMDIKRNRGGGEYMMENQKPGISVSSKKVLHM
jgi:hypothetical protein